MATGWFGPCPHCNGSLSYLEGVSGSTWTPVCPRCRQTVKVGKPTFLMVDPTTPSPPRPPEALTKPKLD